jgi:hypothetical protein
LLARSPKARSHDTWLAPACLRALCASEAPSRTRTAPPPSSTSAQRSAEDGHGFALANSLTGRPFVFASSKSLAKLLAIPLNGQFFSFLWALQRHARLPFLSANVRRYKHSLVMTSIRPHGHGTLRPISRE